MVYLIDGDAIKLFRYATVVRSPILSGAFPNLASTAPPIDFGERAMHNYPPIAIAK
ncbi:MAG: hypothetical protein IM473_22105 [Microcystis sp. M015S2]|uniref:hypothetical protein n=1 Tax=unclassified Microcystis TaxID=2643300 RepID=UPI002586F1D0|nr:MULTISPECIES: hypothetical protein [unclassified Microcystis]MCA2710477.1 hypothetical protein [Microcystis sp. M025S2]MCA2744990.1 hypothetical protein [Microcystis sp. M015S2]MCA2760808.1 hypothetical protein [Microcystis sp. M145S2]